LSTASLKSLFTNSVRVNLSCSALIFSSNLNISEVVLVNSPIFCSNLANSLVLVFNSEVKLAILLSFFGKIARKNDIYYRKGLVEFLIASDAKKLKGARERKLMIGWDNSQETKKLEPQYQNRVEVPPKRN